MTTFPASTINFEASDDTEILALAARWRALDRQWLQHQAAVEAVLGGDIEDQEYRRTFAASQWAITEQICAEQVVLEQQIALLTPVGPAAVSAKAALAERFVDIDPDAALALAARSPAVSPGGLAQSLHASLPQLLGVLSTAMTQLSVMVTTGT